MSSHTHAHTLSVTLRYPESSVTRAGGSSAPALIEGLTSAMLSYFHPPQIFRQPGKKGREIEKLEAWDLSSFLHTLNSFHLSSQFAESRDHLLCNEKVGWEREWSLQLLKAFRLSVWNFQNALFISPLPSLSIMQLQPASVLLQLEVWFLFLEVGEASRLRTFYAHVL